MAKRKEKKTEVPMHFYALTAESERGKRFLKIVEQGAEADKKAGDLLREYGASARIPEMYADFGGVAAMVFDKEPDKDVFRAIEQKTTEGDTLYIPNVMAEDNVCLWEKADELTGENMIKSSKPFTANNAMMLVGRKKVAQAVGMELKYSHPAEMLQMLGVKREKINDYINNKVSMEEILKPMFLASKRDKAYKLLAIGADKETRELEAKIDGKEFCVYTTAKGSDAAVKLFFQMRQLPVVPQGALNSAAGIEDNSTRCAFFALEGIIYIMTRHQSSLTETDGMTVITKEVFVEKAKELKEKFKKSHKPN